MMMRLGCLFILRATRDILMATIPDLHTPRPYTLLINCADVADVNHNADKAAHLTHSSDERKAECGATGANPLDGSVFYVRSRFSC